MQTHKRMNMKLGSYLQASGILLALVVALGLLHPVTEAYPSTEAQAGGTPVPTYKVDPFWPKPLPATKDAQGFPHQWVTGEVAASCVDSRDHLITANRGYLPGGLVGYDGIGAGAIPAPPVVVYDLEGNVVSSWGDPTLSPTGAANTLPHNFHGCYVDQQDNIWLGGMGDGIVQKWSNDGKTMLLQIGTKGTCDGPPTLSPKEPYPTCGEPGNNTSHTLLNRPSDLAVDPNPDPVTGERGSVYISDGYGNHRMVVFDAKGKYLRQWGGSGTGPGQFVPTGGGHPHCVALSNEGLLYTCDRGPGGGKHQSRIQVFDKVGTLKQTIPLNPPNQLPLTGRVSHIVFSRDPEQTFMFVADLGTNAIQIMERKSGRLVGTIGRAGRMAGQMAAPHTLGIDSKGNIYVAETITGRRLQKFVKAGG